MRQITFITQVRPGGGVQSRLLPSAARRVGRPPSRFTWQTHGAASCSPVGRMTGLVTKMAFMRASHVMWHRSPHDSTMRSSTGSRGSITRGSCEAPSSTTACAVASHHSTFSRCAPRAGLQCMRTPRSSSAHLSSTTCGGGFAKHCTQALRQLDVHARARAPNGVSLDALYKATRPYCCSL